MTSAPTLKVFISYSHKDEDLKEELEGHLANLIRQNRIKIWHDRMIEPGTDWDTAIAEQLKAAQVILLLVTPGFMASDYIHNIELSHAIERHEQGTARVIPIILKPTDWTGTAFSKLQALPKNAKPVKKWDDQDEAFLDVVQGIRKAVDSLAASLPSSGSSTSASPASNPTPSAQTQSDFSAMSPIKQRLELNRLLGGVPGTQLSAVITVIRPPAGVVPPASAPQGDRVAALMEWAEGPNGCGLVDLKAIVDQVIN